MSLRAQPDWTPERLAQRYVRDGVALRALVTESGLAYGTVHKRLLAAGVTMRPRGGARPAQAPSPRVVKSSRAQGQ